MKRVYRNDINDKIIAKDIDETCSIVMLSEYRHQWNDNANDYIDVPKGAPYEATAGFERARTNKLGYWLLKETKR